MRFVFSILSFVLGGFLWEPIRGECQEEQEIVVLSPHWEGIRYEFGEAFKRHIRATEKRDISVRWLDVGGGASDILRFIRSEFKAKPGAIGVDLLFGGGTEPFRELKRENLLTQITIERDVLSGIPEALFGAPLYDRELTWYSAVASGFGIICNKRVLSNLGVPFPQSFSDLADHRLRGWVSSADPRKSGSAHMAYEVILQGYGWIRGWEIIQSIGANVRNFGSSANQTPKEVALGEVACGFSIDSAAWTAVREVGSEYLGFLIPSDLTVINGDAVSVLKGAPNKSLARKFIQFILSDAGQQLWLLPAGTQGGPVRFTLGRMAIRRETFDRVGPQSVVPVNPFEIDSNFLYDAELGARRWQLINDLLGTWVIDVREKLARARSSNETRILPPPISEEVASILMRDQVLVDPRRRAEKLSEWQSASKERFPTSLLDESMRALPFLVLVIGLLFYLFTRGRKPVR